jgi:hypothetical protein
LRVTDLVRAWRSGLVGDGGLVPDLPPTAVDAPAASPDRAPAAVDAPQGATRHINLTWSRHSGPRALTL